MSDLKLLIVEYWDLKTMKVQIKKDLADIETKIAEATGCVSGKIQESMEKKEIPVGDEMMTTIVNYMTTREYPDWEYLKSVLTEDQLKRSKKIVKIANMRIMSPILGKDDDE